MAEHDALADVGAELQIVLDELGREAVAARGRRDVAHPVDDDEPPLGVLEAGAVVTFICFAIGYWSLSTMEETFGKELDYTE